VYTNTKHGKRGMKAQSVSGTGHVHASSSETLQTGASRVRVSTGNHNVGNHGSLERNSSNGVVYGSGNASRLKAIQHKSQENGTG